MPEKCPRCSWYFTAEQQAERFFRCPQCGLKQAHEVIPLRERLLRTIPNTETLYMAKKRKGGRGC